KGYPTDKPPEVCSECDGTGTKGGSFPLKRTCPKCDGAGTVRKYTCKACAGDGVKREKDRLKVTVPAGVDTGTKLRLKSRGEAARDEDAAARCQGAVREARDGVRMTTSTSTTTTIAPERARGCARRASFLHCGTSLNEPTSAAVETLRQP